MKTGGAGGTLRVGGRGAAGRSWRVTRAERLTPSTGTGINGWMGSSYTNIVVRGARRAEVVEYLTERRRAAFVAAAGDRLAVVYDAECESQDWSLVQGLTATLSARFGSTALGALLHDDDVLLYCLYQGGRPVDEYNSHPSFGEAGPHEPPTGGDARLLCLAFRVPEATEAVGRLLHRPNFIGEDDYLSTDRRHQELVRLLGLPTFAAGLGYRYAARGSQELAFFGLDDTSLAHTAVRRARVLP
jgi:hypothetical protein